MTEAFLLLSTGDRREALAVAASTTGRPAHLLEKDIWVVWTLDTMFSAPFGAHLVFKGGTSLSKVYAVIRRFSEDVDLTYDMRALAGNLVGHGNEPTPASTSQAKKWGDKIKALLAEWVSGDALTTINDALKGAGLAASAALDPTDAASIIVDYDPASAKSLYTSHAVKLEFGARSTGEPASTHTVVCDAAATVPSLAFPNASPRVMHAERTFWEKATAIHVFASGGKFRGQSRFSRHWYDLMQLDETGFAEKALGDRDLAKAVATHKTAFFSERDAAGQVIDYQRAVAGGLRLMPGDADLEKLRDDYGRMVSDGLLLDAALSFDEVLSHCRALEVRANAATTRPEQSGSGGNWNL